MSTAFAMLAAVALDALLGEPRRAHPLVMFGRIASLIERTLHADSRVVGALAWWLAVAPPVLAVAWLTHALASWMSWIIAACVLYLAIGHRSLAEHARAVESALRAGDLETARTAASGSGLLARKGGEGKACSDMTGLRNEGRLSHWCREALDTLRGQQIIDIR